MIKEIPCLLFLGGGSDLLGTVLALGAGDEVDGMGDAIPAKENKAGKI